jgi:hypothetical protein
MVFGLGCAFIIMGILFYMLKKYVDEPFQNQKLDSLQMDDAETASYHRFDGSGATT